MKISWNNLKQLVDLNNIKIDEVAHKLTLAGFEIESITYINEIKDTILEANITANRKDITGWAQIALELSAILKRPLKIKKSQLCNLEIKRFLKTKNLDFFQELYICYVNKQYKLHRNNDFAKYAKVLDFNKTESILDIINFVNLKWGQSIHAYKLQSEKIQEAKNFTIEAKYDKNYESGKGIKFFIDNEELTKITAKNTWGDINACNIALINYKNKEKGRNSSSLNEFKNSYFNAYSEILYAINQIGQKDNRYNIVYYYYQNHKNQKHIICKTEDINKILGPINEFKNNTKFLNSSTIACIAKNLRLSTEHIDNDILKITVPLERNDIEDKADIAEEVARIYGFNYFYDRLPKFKYTHTSSNKNHAKKKIRRVLRSMGLHEVINYSLQRRKMQNSRLSIINPLNQEQEILRNNLIDGILANKKYNENQANNNFEAFEIGNIFNKTIHELSYQESMHLCCLLSNNSFNKSTWQTNKTALTWLQAKGHIEEFFERINASIAWSTSTNSNRFTECIKQHTHATNSIYAVSHGEAIGILSQVNYLNKRTEQNTYFLEISLNKLVKIISSIKHLKYIYSPYSNYPKITRDFSITIDRKVSVEEIRKVIKEAENKENNAIESAEILSEYWNSQYQRTICLRIVYRSQCKTLTSKDAKILDNMLKLKFSSYNEARRKPDSVLNNLN